MYVCVYVCIHIYIYIYIYTLYMRGRHVLVFGNWLSVENNADRPLADIQVGGTT